MANIVRVLVQAEDNATEKFSKIGKSAALMGTAIVGVGAAAAVGLFKMGQSFDKAFDTIAVGTGATGKDLDGLEKSFKNVFKSLPTDMGSASKAIADLNTRTGATGKTLEAMSASMLEMTRITGGDLDANITAVTRAMGDWGVEAEDSTGFMDKLFIASQATGVGIDTLANQMVQFGAPMRQLGFSVEEAAALFGKFEREGVNAELVMGSMRIALGKMARDGEPAVETFQRVVESIEAAGGASEANALALELFGARAGPDMAAAIREGRFAVDDLVAALGESDGAIMETAKSTRSAGESFQILKNQVVTAMEPAATAVFEFAGKVTQFLLENGPKWAAWYDQNVKPSIDAFIGFVLPQMQQFADFAGEKFREFAAYYTSDIKPALDNIRAGVEAMVGFVETHWKKFETVFGPIINQFKNIIATAVLIIREHFQILIDLLGGDFAGAWNNTKELIAGVMEFWKATIENAIELILGLAGLAGDAGKALGMALMDGLEAALGAAGGIASGIAGAIGSAVRGMINGIIDGINSALEFTIPVPLAPDIHIDAPDIPHLASGGIVTRPTLALIGEAGPEAVVPLSRMGGGGTTVVIEGPGLSMMADLLRVSERQVFN